MSEPKRFRKITDIRVNQKVQLANYSSIVIQMANLLPGKSLLTVEVFAALWHISALRKQGIITGGREDTIILCRFDMPGVLIF